ncbi:STAS domain-containing protein [Mesobacillus subterraneus]|uniref:STAS domain-containing protein n=1 Tax=Mesobacillus subterraneus TaxID=285983 RepID=UPI00203EC457|nr:STAS domain-containing protein [Mesobacillus subterraneus]MCM3664834.1 STAS domain-containing protein [Mesobacillus subterraneus]MCM3681923.1 STAS domain-containing protein [Mesobacillus subterraneus]
MEKERLQELEKKIQEYETIISEMSAPIIPSILPETILVPITGLIRAERFDKIREKLLNYIHNKEIQTAIIDLTDITGERVEDVCLEEVGRELHEMASSMSLMGVRTFFVGMNTELVKRMVLDGIKLEAQTFSTFQSALKYLMKEKGLEFRKMVE